MNRSVGERVRQVRGELNQRVFAEKLGVSLGSISQIEQGKAMPSGEFLLKIHAAFGVDVTWLLTGMNNEPSILSRRESVLLDNYRHCLEEDQAAIERVALNAAKAKQGSLGNKCDKNAS